MDINLKQTWNKNELILTDKQCLIIHEYTVKTGMVIEKCDPNEKQKIFFGRAFYEFQKNKYPSPDLCNEQYLYVFNYHIPELPKEIANLFLETANTEEEKIALGRIYWKLLGIQKGMNS